MSSLRDLDAHEHLSISCLNQFLTNGINLTYVPRSLEQTKIISLSRMFAIDAFSRSFQVLSSYVTPLTQLENVLYTIIPPPRSLFNKLKLSFILVFKMDLDSGQWYSANSRPSLWGSVSWRSLTIWLTLLTSSTLSGYQIISLFLENSLTFMHLLYFHLLSQRTECPP